MARCLRELAYRRENHMKHRIALWILAIALLLAGCSAPPPAQPTSPPVPAAPAAATTLTVLAAASLSDAFGELGAQFEAANPGVTITYSFAGSQQLAAQILEGAPADVFASANQRQIDAVVAGGRITTGVAQTFARNRLTIVTPPDNPAHIQTLTDLAGPGVKLILADRAVPVGQYSLDLFAKASSLPAYTAAYSPTVLANVVSYEDNVRSVLAKIILGEADAGIVYTSDVALEAAKVRQIAIPDELNTIAIYPIAPIADSQQPELARRFIDYVRSAEGQQILVRYGFIAADL